MANTLLAVGLIGVAVALLALVTPPNPDLDERDPEQVDQWDEVMK